MGLAKYKRGGISLTHSGEMAARDFQATLGTFFYGQFYGLEIFGCKTAQFYAMRCKLYSLGSPLVRNALQHSENVRNSLGLN